MGFEAARNDGWTATRQAIIATAADFSGPVTLLHEEKNAVVRVVKDNRKDPIQLKDTVIKVTGPRS